MRSLTYIISLGLLLVLTGCTSKQQQNTLSEKEINEGWELLFDGKSTDNWKTFNGGEVTGWKIINGVLHNSGVGSNHGGDIISKKEYDNFELYLEWKIAPKSNSGIFFRVQEGLTNAIYESGPEYQLIDDKGWPTKLEPHQYSGANYGMHSPQNAKVVGIEEWNVSRIIANGSQIEHWLNGHKVVEYDLWTDSWQELKAKSKWADKPHYGMAQSGHIGLQDHGGLTMFRNIKIRKL